jgi:hypothetical protein
LISADIAPEVALEIARDLRRSDDPRRILKEHLLKYAKKLQAPDSKTQTE